MISVRTAFSWLALHLSVGLSHALVPALPPPKTADLSISGCVKFESESVVPTLDSKKTMTNLLALTKAGDFKLFLSQQYFEAVTKGQPLSGVFLTGSAGTLARRRAVTTLSTLIDRVQFQTISLRLAPDPPDWQWVRLGARCGDQSLLLTYRQVVTYYGQSIWVEPRLCVGSDADEPGDLRDCEIVCTEVQCARENK